MKEKGNRMIK